MKKLLLFANDTTYTYNLRRELIRRFIQDGYDVAAVCERLTLAEELEALGCRITDIAPGRHGTDPVEDTKLLLKYIKVLRSEKPDAVITYNIKPNVYCGLACRMLGIKYYPNVTGIGTVTEKTGLMKKLILGLYRAGLSGASCIFFQNAENLAMFRTEKIISEKNAVRLIPGSGVSLETHRPFPYERGEDVNFLFVGRIMHEKGIDELLAAIPAVREKHPEAKFHFCGYFDEEKYKTLFAEAEKNGELKYYGEQKDVRPFYQMAHCVVLPSYFEGMSNVLLEAGAHARPVITSDCSGCRDAADENENGFLVPVKDADALAAAMEKFLSLSFEEREQMGVKGREKIEKEFDRQIVADAYINEINR